MAERTSMTNPEYEMEPCAKGKYNDITNKILETDCLACPAGKACNELGMGVSASALPDCAKGFYCI
jgi:hypothetical protein